MCSFTDVIAGLLAMARCSARNPAAMVHDIIGHEMLAGSSVPSESTFTSCPFFGKKPSTPVKDPPLVSRRGSECTRSYGAAGQHAERWQQLHFSAVGDSGQHLSVVKGRLHSLTTLHLLTQCKGLDALEVAPALQIVSFTGAPKYIPRLPWSQIRVFKFLGSWHTNDLLAPSNALCTTRLLGRGAQFCFNAELKNPGAEWVSVSSDLGSLSLALELAPESAKFVLGRRDTLPVWNSDQFAAFAARSSLHTHLLYLHLRVVIIDDELLRALTALPSLESLTASEHNDHISITDVPLEGLTWNPQRGLSLPKLEHLSLSSRRKFSDTAYVDCLLTRAQLRLHAGDTPFRAHLRSLTPEGGDFPPKIQARLSDIVLRGHLVFTTENQGR
ncbi:hypothetical protein DFH06DRAFT_1441129 [Mycena polygramma]|nr:hypothetical protein DFH06DRAFT_1441129 [Mycena polygramma]